MLRHLLLFPSLFCLLLGQQCPPGGDCPFKYQCDQGPFSPHDYSNPGLSLFAAPCRCDDGWNDAFCSKPETYSKSAPMTAHAPTVCICRVLSDSNLRCEQFITRCYSKHGRCKCCFKQEEPFCDQVACEDDKPQFQASSNTTCECFHRPVDYPTEICDRDTKELLEYEQSRFYMNVFGYSVHALIIIAAAVLLIILLIGCTFSCIKIASNRRRRERNCAHLREERERAQRERRLRMEGVAEAQSFIQ